jgi:hypothetical protein
MTSAQRIHQLTSIEHQLLSAGDALSAVIDDEDALAGAVGGRSPCPKSIGDELRRAKDLAYWAVARVREELRRHGALEPAP